MKRRTNIRRIPDDILSKVNNIRNNRIVVAAKRAYAIDSIKRGDLKHLGVKIAADGSVICPDEPILPAASNILVRNWQKTLSCSIVPN